MVGRREGRGRGGGREVRRNEECVSVSKENLFK